MLSTPQSLGFVLAMILGAMLVPGCRPENSFSKRQVQSRTGSESSLGSELSFGVLERTAGALVTK